MGYQRIASSHVVAMQADNDIRICIPLNERTLDELAVAAESVLPPADLIELRTDGLDAMESAQSSSRLKQLIGRIDKGVVLTFRATHEGGYREVSEIERRSFWQYHLDSRAAFFDIEFDLVNKLTQVAGEEQPDWSRVICSHHDFSGIPANLTELYEQMAFTPARILKLAVTPKDIVDCIEIFVLLDKAIDAGRETIAIAMGNYGVITRILGPGRGSFLTYGSADFEKGTAPGQILASELRSVYRIDQINRDTVVTGLVGLPAVHSVSPHMHNAAFAATNLDAVYLPLEVSNLGTFMKRMVDKRSREFDWNLRGLSITAPHKVEVMQYLDWIDADAKKIGAVNTIVLENEQLLGYNTDADGLIEPLKRRLGSLAGARAAVIGGGGAAGAAVYALQVHGVDVHLFARNLDKAGSLAQRFNISCKSLTSAQFSGYDIVINATPLGSSGVDINNSPANAEQLHGSRLVYDLVYNPIETRFLQAAREVGCEVLGGLEMLVAQAQLQFKFWMNTTPSYELMYNAALTALTKKFTSRSSSTS